jgi:adenosylcobinamide kinase/adenosylcobinamide-phosphate guanylyltransferase
MAKKTLVTGGSRSGKSTFALQGVLQGDYQRRGFVATAVAFDDEMRDRIDKHQEERGDDFLLFEEPVNLCEAIKTEAAECDVILVDCLTVWLGNLFHEFDEDEGLIRKVLSELVVAVEQTETDLVMVTNEVGCGIIPENRLARRFRDMSGFMNRIVAEACDEVYLCSCGLPLQLK